MNLLVTGGATAGSWQIRGAQLGAAIGATVLPKAVDMDPFDAVVIVKRHPFGMADRVRISGAVLIWDLVDAWPQPIGNGWGRGECLAWLRQQVNSIRPAGIVAATRAMAADCAEFGVPVLALPHHARPGLDANPIREHVQTVGYEGGEGYITGWRQHIEAECKRRGWRFVVNPARLADVDIVLALRDATGYAPRHWKSNVKLANAQGSGTPFIGCREAGYLETAIGTCEKWADTPEELKRAFDALSPQGERRRVSQWMRSVAPALDQVAIKYRAWLEQVCATAPKS